MILVNDTQPLNVNLSYDAPNISNKKAEEIALTSFQQFPAWTSAKASSLARRVVLILREIFNWITNFFLTLFGYAPKTTENPVNLKRSQSRDFNLRRHLTSSYTPPLSNMSNYLTPAPRIGFNPPTKHKTEKSLPPNPLAIKSTVNTLDSSGEKLKLILSSNGSLEELTPSISNFNPLVLGEPQLSHSLTFANQSVSVEVVNPFSLGTLPTDLELSTHKNRLRQIFSEIKDEPLALVNLPSGQKVYLEVPKEEDEFISMSLSLSYDPTKTPALESPVETIADVESFPILKQGDNYHVSGLNLFLNYTSPRFRVYTEVNHSNLQCAIDYCIELANSDFVLEPLQKEKIRLFFDKLKSVNLNFGKLLGGQEKLQRVISPRLDELLKIAEPNQDQKLEIDLARAELATSFGHGIVPTGAGKNGAMFIKTLEDKPVGVFKAPKELGIFDWIEIAKTYVGQARLLNQDKFAQQLAEVVASDLCEALKFNRIAPKAIMASFCGEKGAFISFISGHKEFSKIVEAFDARKTFEEGEINIWQMMGVWNFLIGNLDPHDDNIFVMVDGKYRLLSLKMIDFGNCFLKSNPAYLAPKGNLGHWGSFKISQEAFTKEVKEFILNNIVVDEIEKVFVKHNDFFKPEMRELMLERVMVLREFVAVGKMLKNPYDLSLIKTDSHFNMLKKRR